ncbi:MAG TPA: glycosyltransferase family 4 protein [Candidatus Acidoferrales bacterium]|nr:glycosyltransferase family 4 protein [Candidatus Acidoferrales bacterium]
MTTRAQSSGRVAHLTSVHSPFDVRIFHKECKSLVRAGYDVTLIASHDRDEMVDGVRVKAMPRSTGRLARMLFTTRAILRQAIREDADLYHFHDPELIPAALLLRFRKKRVIYDVHENVPADVSAKHYIPQPFRQLVAWIAGWIEIRAARHFSGVVPATSEICRRFEFRSTGVALIRNYPSICEAPTDPIPWSRRTPSIVYAGLLSEGRCIKEILQAMALLPTTLEATATFAGAFSPPSYASDIAGVAVGHRAKFLGFVDRVGVARLFDEGRVGLCLCRPTLCYLESAPTKIFEYMQAGIPVIASDFPAFRAIVGTARCGVLVNPLDPPAIARVIEYLLTHPAEAEEMGRRGQEAARRTFNWASEEGKLLDLYEDLLDDRHAVSANSRERVAE